MTKTFVASVKDKDTKEVKVISSSDYSTKKEFTKVLRDNNYAVRFISTPENFDTDCEKYYAKLEEASKKASSKRWAQKETERMITENEVNAEATQEVTEEVVTTVQETPAQATTTVNTAPTNLVNLTGFSIVSNWSDRIIPITTPITMNDIRNIYLSDGNYLIDSIGNSYTAIELIKEIRNNKPKYCVMVG